MSDLSALSVIANPIRPQTTINEVAELLLENDYRQFLCLPVVADGLPVGVVSRHQLQRIFMSRYGRELHGRNPVTKVMNPAPLTVELGQPVEVAAQFVTRNIQYPITEDFIITRDGQYHGMGFVVDLLGAMEQRVAQRNIELARALQNLKASQAQLVQSEKMASLGQMVAGVAHEINTPLGYVKNNVEMARDLFHEMRGLLDAYQLFLGLFSSEGVDEAAIGQQLATVQELSRHLEEGFPPEEVEGLYGDTLFGIGQISEMVLNLKNFSRLDQATVANVSLNECIDSALLIARNLLKHKAEVVREYGELPRISCSPSQINQVFLNLLSNAAQAIEDNGRIHIKTYADGEFVYASVQDTGKGIPKEHLARIFDPFFTTKPVGHGTGLGLSISFQIIQKHGGQIRVGSQVGVGTRFLVALPRNAKQQEVA
jgi:two-component system, NtrC family, sensor kinase